MGYNFIGLILLCLKLVLDHVDGRADICTHSAVKNIKQDGGSSVKYCQYKEGKNNILLLPGSEFVQNCSKCICTIDGLKCCRPGVPPAPDGCIVIRNDCKYRTVLKADGKTDCNKGMLQNNVQLRMTPPSAIHTHALNKPKSISAFSLHTNVTQQLSPASNNNVNTTEYVEYQPYPHSRYFDSRANSVQESSFHIQKNSNFNMSEPQLFTKGDRNAPTNKVDRKNLNHFDNRFHKNGNGDTIRYSNLAPNIDKSFHKRTKFNNVSLHNSTVRNDFNNFEKNQFPENETQSTVSSSSNPSLSKDHQFFESLLLRDLNSVFSNPNSTTKKDSTNKQIMVVQSVRNPIENVHAKQLTQMHSINGTLTGDMILSATNSGTGINKNLPIEVLDSILDSVIADTNSSNFLAALNFGDNLQSRPLLKDANGATNRKTRIGTNSSFRSRKAEIRPIPIRQIGWGTGVMPEVVPIVYKRQAIDNITTKTHKKYPFKIKSNSRNSPPTNNDWNLYMGVANPYLGTSHVGDMTKVAGTQQNNVDITKVDKMGQHLLTYLTKVKTRPDKRSWMALRDVIWGHDGSADILRTSPVISDIHNVVQNGMRGIQNKKKPSLSKIDNNKVNVQGDSLTPFDMMQLMSLMNGEVEPASNALTELMGMYKAANQFNGVMGFHQPLSNEVIGRNYDMRKIQNNQAEMHRLLKIEANGPSAFGLMGFHHRPSNEAVGPNYEKRKILNNQAEMLRLLKIEANAPDFRGGGAFASTMFPTANTLSRFLPSNEAVTPPAFGSTISSPSLW